MSQQESSRPSFNDMVRIRNEVGAYACIGIDPNLDKLAPRLGIRVPDQGVPVPAALLESMMGAAGDKLLQFCKEYVDATAPFAACFKPNEAFFEGSLGWYGVRIMYELRQYARARHPGIPFIRDSKKGDIGKTCKKYASAVYGFSGADAVTLNPYLGFTDAISHFYEDYHYSAAVILCRTSNQKGAAEIQDRIMADGRPLYEHVAELIERENQKHGNCWAVVGATGAEELQRICKLMPSVKLLIPGFGDQGAATSKIIPCVRDRLILPNSSGGIMFAFEKEAYGHLCILDAAAAAAWGFNEEIKKYYCEAA